MATASASSRLVRRARAARAARSRPPAAGPSYAPATGREGDRPPPRRPARRSRSRRAGARRNRRRDAPGRGRAGTGRPAAAGARRARLRWRVHRRRLVRDEGRGGRRVARREPGPLGELPRGRRRVAAPVTGARAPRGRRACRAAARRASPPAARTPAAGPPAPRGTGRRSGWPRRAASASRGTTCTPRTREQLRRKALAQRLVEVVAAEPAPVQRVAHGRQALLPLRHRVALPPEQHRRVRHRQHCHRSTRVVGAQQRPLLLRARSRSPGASPSARACSASAALPGGESCTPSPAAASSSVGARRTRPLRARRRV